MKIELLCVGKLRSAEIRRLCDEYKKRLSRYDGGVEIREVKAASAKDPKAAAIEEVQRLTAALKPNDAVWILDERGRLSDSVGLSRSLTELELRSTKRLCVVLGGAYGLTDEIRKRGKLISLSKLTFPHEICRLVILEQLYRARTIQRGEPYHHE